MTIEERFLSARADPFAPQNRPGRMGKRESARSVRNDGVGGEARSWWAAGRSDGGMVGRYYGRAEDRQDVTRLRASLASRTAEDRRQALRKAESRTCTEKRSSKERAHPCRNLTDGPPTLVSPRHTVISNGAGRLFLPHSLPANGSACVERNLSPIEHPAQTATPLVVLSCSFPGLCIATRRRLIAIPPFPVPQSAAVDRTSHVYLMASKSGVLYVGVTSNLAKRIAQHKSQQVPGFTQKYNVTKLVWFEPHADVRFPLSHAKRKSKPGAAPRR